MNLSYFDAHCDTLTTGDLYHQVHLSEERFARRGQIFAVCADGVMQADDSFFQQAVSKLSAMPGAVLCRTGEAMEQALQNKQIAAILSIEGADVVGCDECRLHHAYETGVRLIGLTHNRFNGLAGTNVEESALGLTGRGRSFAAKAVELGMILDISHLSDRSAAELLAAYPGRVIASHSNARTLCGHPRNLTDDLFRQLLDAGGICGINLYTRFLTGGTQAKVEDAVRHIEYFRAMDDRAESALALGCDFDGCAYLPDEIQTSPAAYVLAEALLQRNYPEETVNRLFFDNLYHFLRRTLPR